MDINEIFDKYALDEIVNALTRYEVAKACSRAYQDRMQVETHKTADRHCRYWSENDDRFLQENPDMPNLELAKALGRTYLAIKTRKKLLRQVLRIAA